MAETKALDDEIVGSFEPAGKARIIWDEEVTGFGVRVLPSGARSWIVGYRGIGPGGKKGSRRLVIGRHGVMPAEQARQKAKEVLADVATEGEPDSEPDEPIVEANVEPATVAATEDSEGHDPETGEIVPAGEVSVDDYDSNEDPDEDLNFGDVGQARNAGRESADVAAGEVGEKAVNSILEGAVDVVTGVKTSDRYEEVAAAARTDAPPYASPTEAANPVGPGMGGDANGEVAGEGAHPEAEGTDSGARNRNEGEEGSGEAEEEPPRSATMENARGAVAGAANKIKKWGRTRTSTGRKGRPAKEDQTAREESKAEPSSGAEGESARNDGFEPSEEPVLGAQLDGAAGALGNSRDGETLSEESVAGLARNLDGIRIVVERIEAWNETILPQLELLSGSAAVIAVDGRQKRWRLARMLLVIVVAAVVGLAGGTALQSRLEVLPQVDPTFGWKDHVWDHYGEAFTECYGRARKDDSGRVKCEIEVRAK